MAFWKKIKNNDAVPVLKEELVFDTEPTMNSTNPVTSDGVARAIAGGSGQITVDQNYNPESANAQAGTAVAQAVESKQDVINDLSTIRSGAALGATAVQPGSLSAVATSGSYSDLSGRPTIPSVDQVYDSTSANAQSGVAVAGAIAGVNQVPASSSGDEGKVLKVNASGNPEWTNETNPLPSLTGNTGKVLAVNSGATGTEWVTAAAGAVLVNLPNDDTSNANVIRPILSTVQSAVAAGKPVIGVVRHENGENKYYLPLTSYSYSYENAWRMYFRGGDGSYDYLVHIYHETSDECELRKITMTWNTQWDPHY